MQRKHKPIPMALAMIGIAGGLPFLFSTLLPALWPTFKGLQESYPWLRHYTMSLSSLLVSLLIIWRISKGKFGDYGFTLRSRDLKLGPSLWIGVIMASLLVIPELSQMVRGSYKLSYDPTLVNVFGMMSFMWIFPGITEETLYRGLMQTYLMNELDGNVKVLRWNLHKGTIIAAIIFGLIHSFRVFSGETIGTAIITVIYAFMYGLIMGYVYQETRSLAGPIIMHNLADGGATTITYLLYLIFS